MYDLKIKFETLEALREWVNSSPVETVVVADGDTLPEVITVSPMGEQPFDVDVTQPFADGDTLPEVITVSPMGEQPFDVDVTQPFADEVHHKEPPGMPPEMEPVSDADGTPWDERIHAGTKTKSKNGVWKKKRGIEDETFNAVMAELNSGTINHSQLLAEIINGVAEGTLSIFTVQDVLAELGLGSLNDASGNPEMIETIATRLEFI